jgi:hypothetical protein
MILILAITAIDIRVVAVPASQNLVIAVEYLRSVEYDPALRLCREAPSAAPNIYWVASDNLLAFKALEPYDAQLASTIISELVRIAELYNLPSSREGVPLSLRYDVVIREDGILEIPPRDITHITLRDDSYQLRYDIANGTGRFEDWREYADLRLLVALSNYNRGDRENAVSNLTSEMWDGIGLRDKAYLLAYGEGQAGGAPNAYATYKLGLLLYVSGKLGIRLSFKQDVVKRIWLMQNKTSGGIFTHIMPDSGWGDSNTNTETTALVILGLTSIQNPVPEFPSGTLITAILVTVLALGAFSIRRLRRAPARPARAV